MREQGLGNSEAILEQISGTLTVILENVGKKTVCRVSDSQSVSNTWMPRCGQGLVKAMNSKRREVFFYGSGGIVCKYVCGGARKVLMSLSSSEALMRTDLNKDKNVGRSGGCLGFV